MNEKPMYLVNGHFIRGNPITEETDPQTREFVAHSAKRFGCSTNDFLVLADAEVIVHGGVLQRVAVMVIPLSHVAGLCVPPYEAVTIEEVARAQFEASRFPK